MKDTLQSNALLHFAPKPITILSIAQLSRSGSCERQQQHMQIHNTYVGLTIKFMERMKNTTRWKKKCRQKNKPSLSLSLRWLPFINHKKIYVGAVYFCASPTEVSWICFAVAGRIVDFLSSSAHRLFHLRHPFAKCVQHKLINYMWPSSRTRCRLAIKKANSELGVLRVFFFFFSIFGHFVESNRSQTIQV